MKPARQRASRDICEGKKAKLLTPIQRVVAHLSSRGKPAVEPTVLILYILATDLFFSVVPACPRVYLLYSQQSRRRQGRRVLLDYSSM